MHQRLQTNGYPLPVKGNLKANGYKPTASKVGYEPTVAKQRLRTKGYKPMVTNQRLQTKGYKTEVTKQRLKTTLFAPL